MLVFVAHTAWAETADEIIEKAQAANRVDSAIESVKMTIVGKSGSERVQELQLKSRREGDASKTYMKVTSPSDLAGTQLLMIDAATDETMVYLPSIGRVNLISGAGRKGQFVGSDLTYEDLEIRDNIQGQRTLVEDRADAWVVDVAMSDGSYEKVRATIGKVDLVMKKVEFYAEGAVVKTIDVVRTAQDGTVTLPVETVVTNHARGTHTKLEIVSHQLNVGKDALPDETFTRAWLERGG